MMGKRRDEFVDVVASGLMYVPNILEGLVLCARLIVVTGLVCTVREVWFHAV